MSNSVRPHRRQSTRLPRPWDSPGKNTGVGCRFLLQCMKVKVKSLSRVWLLATLWTAAHQAPPSMGFSRQEYWSGVPLPSPSCTLAPVKLLYGGEKRRKTQTDRNLSLFSFVLGDMLDFLVTWLNTKRGENKINKIQEGLGVGKLSRLLWVQEGCLGWGEAMTEVKDKWSDIWVMNVGIWTTSCTGFLITAMGLRSRDGSDTNLNYKQRMLGN